MSGSAFASDPSSEGPGSGASRTIPGLFVSGFIALALLMTPCPSPAGAGTVHQGQDSVRLSLLVQAPGDPIPPDDGDNGEVDEEEGILVGPEAGVAPVDSTGLVPAPMQGEKSVVPDSLGGGLPAPGIPQPGAAPADSLLPSGAAPPDSLRPPGGAAPDSLRRVSPGTVPGTVGGAPPRAGAPPGPATAQKKPAERRGLAGLHPALIVAGLVALHFVLVGAFTD